MCKLIPAFLVRSCLAVFFCLGLSSPLLFGIDVSSNVKDKTGSAEGLDAVTAATQFAEASVAVVLAEDPAALQTDSTGPFGRGEIERLVSEAVGMTGLPRIWAGSSVRRVLILTDVSYPVYNGGLNADPHVAAALVRKLFRVDSTLSITLACAPEHWVSPEAYGAPESLAADGFAAAGYRKMVESLTTELPGLDLTLMDLSLDSTLACTTYIETAGECDKVFAVASAVIRADYLIVLAKLKTGPLGLDCAVGALRLSLPGPVNGWPRFAELEPRLLDETLVSLLGSINVDYVLVDAISCLEGAGTGRQSVAAVGAVLAGEDIAAVDAAAAKLTGFDPLDMEYLDLAGELLLGVVEWERISILGEVELPAGQILLAKPRRLFGLEELSNPDYLYQGQGVRNLMYGFGDSPTGNRDSVHLPYPGLEGWTTAGRSPDEPLGPGAASGGRGSFHAFTYYWCPDSAGAQLWVGSQIAVQVYLNGALVLERGEGTQGEPLDFRVPNETVSLELPAGGGTLEIYGEFGPDNDPEGLFSLHLARRTEEKRHAGSRVPDLVYFLNPAGEQSRSGVVGRAAPGLYVRSTAWDGTTNTGVCGAQGAFVLKELAPGETLLNVYDPTGRLVADSTLYLEEWETLRVDFQRLGEPSPPGDYTGDGRLAINDVIALLLGMRDHPGDLHYDFNGDGRLAVTDAIALLLFMMPG